MAVIVDTSCLIVLSKIGKLSLLEHIFDEVMIPEAVYREYGDALPVFIEVIGVSGKYKKKLELSALDPGESEVIALALEKECRGVVIDERKGRRVAKEFGLKVIGTLGILILAKNRGLIPDVKSIVEEIMNQGFRVSNKQLQDISKYF